MPLVATASSQMAETAGDHGGLVTSRLPGKGPGWQSSQVQGAACPRALPRQRTLHTQLSTSSREPALPASPSHAGPWGSSLCVSLCLQTLIACERDRPFLSCRDFQEPGIFNFRASTSLSCAQVLPVNFFLKMKTCFQNALRGWDVLCQFK